ncbi:hypothetical protein E2C01_056013 [Portunus trituberculatus]|uniref:Secreted protein n=1 Tax=Portunus trituberculatus TaxID=210409 RepID=A0A5B7GW86_PORTR|nr:hypothetical protein [Portunus trituberculatus]
MFLLALASACLVSGLHGLSGEVCHSKGWTSMTFSFAPDFLVKFQCLDQHSFDEFTIPALLEFVGEDEVDHLLSLVWAVREYLRGLRIVGRPALGCWSRIRIHCHTLSKWFCQVIWRAYASVLEEELHILKVNTHEVQAIATSVLFRKVKILDLVLKAGTWKSMTTFSSFYL